MNEMEQTTNNKKETEQVNHKRDLSDYTHPDYDSSEDPNVTDTIDEEVGRWLDKLLPYKRYIMIGGTVILIILVVFLGYALGGLKVCNDLDGILDSKFKCHPDFINEQRKLAGVNEYGLPILVPNFTFGNGT